MSKISFLHLSDLHFGKSTSKSVNEFYSTICRDLKKKSNKIDLIICTGDIVDGKSTNKKDQFNYAVIFFKKLLNRINKDKLYNDKELTLEDILFVPGNHDVERSSDLSEKYSNYNLFLKNLYGERKNHVRINYKYGYVIKIYKEEKIAFVGLNSCMGDNGLSSQDEEWIDSLDLTSANIKEAKISEIKQLLKKSKINYDDYGKIEIDQILDAFDELKEEIKDLDTFRIVSFFHHHIQPFPEIYDKDGDVSMIRNFSTVINTLIDNNVRFIFHGHKHIPISRLITTNQFFENPQKCIYAFSSGTLGNDGHRVFEVADIYSPKELMEATISKFNYYSTEELQKVDIINIPPKYSDKSYYIGSLQEILQTKNISLFNKYNEYIKGSDNTSYHYHIDSIINSIKEVLLNFEVINNDLLQNPNIIAIILSSIHRRIITWDTFYKKNDNELITKRIGGFYKECIIENKSYISEVESLLSTLRNESFNDLSKKIFESEKYSDYKKITCYIVLVSFLTDLYLSISDFGEEYFNREGIDHKINIKLNSNEFYDKIPNDSVKIIGDEDRRSATISFICKNPTVHKVSVLIAKDFEDRINNLEEIFNYLTLKLYYVRPKIQKSGYGLDNYNFEAYIPSLIPLLTGDNLYSQKEVFIRELIQNSFDAIKLREKIDESNFSKDIIINISEDSNSQRRYLQIIDEGIGMDIYKVERYFTNIGRSFYKSHDFEELQKEKNIEYKALSSFGIGFLSVFMVSNEVFVQTKDTINSNIGIDIHIPNYEGCFFISKDEKIKATGTDIKIYEDKRKLINVERIENYIIDNFKLFQYNILLHHRSKRVFSAEDFVKSLGDNYLYIPLINGEIKRSEKLNKLTEPYYGLIIHLNNKLYEKCKTQFFNEGIKIKRSDIADFDNMAPFPVIFNLPSSMLILNVSRDLLIKIENEYNVVGGKSLIEEEIVKQIYYRVLIKKENIGNRLYDINKLICLSYFYKKMDSLLLQESYCLMILYKDNNFDYLLVTQKEMSNFLIDSNHICCTICNYEISPGSELNRLMEYIANKVDISIIHYPHYTKYFKKLLKEDILENELIYEWSTEKKKNFKYLNKDMLETTYLIDYIQEYNSVFKRSVFNEEEKREEFAGCIIDAIKDLYTNMLMNTTIGDLK